MAVSRETVHLLMAMRPIMGEPFLIVVFTIPFVTTTTLVGVGAMMAVQVIRHGLVVLQEFANK